MDIDLLNSLKRSSSVPIINNLNSAQQRGTGQTISIPITMASTQTTNSPTTRETSQPPALNIFAPRARRYSASFSPLAAGNNGTLGPRLTPRVSQLRQEECADISNSREVTHEREIHTAMQISQSWEDLTLDAENWSVRGDTDLTNPLHVTLPTVSNSISSQCCSSPSPNRTPIRLPYGLSPSPTRRTFATRRSMSPIAMRPSSLGPVKRKFDVDDNYANNCSPPPFKKMLTERGNSPICQSPDSTEGRTTPKLYVSKLYTNNTYSSSSLSSSPSTTSAPSPSMEIQMDLPNMLPLSSSAAAATTMFPCINSTDNGKSIADDANTSANGSTATAAAAAMEPILNNDNHVYAKNISEFSNTTLTMSAVPDKMLMSDRQAKIVDENNIAEEKKKNDQQAPNDMNLCAENNIENNCNYSFSNISNNSNNNNSHTSCTRSMTATSLVTDNNMASDNLP